MYVCMSIFVVHVLLILNDYFLIAAASYVKFFFF